MDGAALGRVICDAYYEGCELVGTEDNTTLSVTDLSKMGDLLDAYESFGKEALAAACADPRLLLPDGPRGGTGGELRRQHP